VVQQHLLPLCNQVQFKNDKVMQDSQIIIDIILINYRSARDTAAAIAGFAPWTDGRVIVVDNSDDNDELTRLKSALADFPEVELLVPESNLGFGNGCNLAYARTTAEWVLLLNPDARIDPANILLLAETLRNSPRFGAVSPRTFWDAQHQFLLPSAFPPTPAMTTALAVASSCRTLAKLAIRQYLEGIRRRMASSRPYHIDFLAGAIMMVRRSAVQSAGGLFRKEYFMFHEDSDLSLRLRGAGYTLGIVPTAQAQHEYRHKPYKATLMAETAPIYFSAHYPLFFRLTAGMSRLSRWGRPVRWEEWGALLPAVESPEELHALLGDGVGVLAISPSPMLMPALLRPAGSPPARLDTHLWELLEPGRYMLLCAGICNGVPEHWASVEKR